LVQTDKGVSLTSSNPPATVAALVDSLRHDPFYVTNTQEFAESEARRWQALGRYFDYSMSEGARMGRLVVWPDPSVGAAVWLLPAQKAVYDAEAKAKAEALATSLGATGADAYWRIIDFMRPRALAVVPESAWYLSIVGVTPSAQGQGIGSRLIEPTLAEADEAGVDCYLETFDDRNPGSTSDLGFRWRDPTPSRSHVQLTPSCGGIRRQRRHTHKPRNKIDPRFTLRAICALTRRAVSSISWGFLPSA
jgi:GNAT superfamily N-acetyltransferase